MSKSTYWIADLDGNKALVEGVDERDRWVKVHGWTESTEPGPRDFVWLRHDEHGGRQRFVAEAVPLWEVRGWRPAAPPEPENLAVPDAQAAPSEPAPAKASTSTTTKPAAKATSGNNEE
jgi:hypothetical protein